MPGSPTRSQKTKRLLGIDQFSALSLLKAFLNLCRDGLAIFKYPIQIPIVLFEQRECTRDRFVLCHSRGNRALQDLLLFGFEFDDHFDQPLSFTGL